MNIRTFPVGSTNIFPIANSLAGGQLLSEFNIRSRESVGTDSSVKYLIGPSFTHSVDDFRVTFYRTDDTVSSRSILRITPGRALFNGHFVQSFEPMDIDMLELNASLLSEDEDALVGDLAIGVRVMYSTEQTIAGTMLVEDEEQAYYNGLHIVILPREEFITPSDSPTDQSKVTAHIKLADFNYINNEITKVVDNVKRWRFLGADRIVDIDELLDATYVSKRYMSPNKLYVFSGKSTESSKDTWCDATDSLIVWDKAPIMTKGNPATESIQEASFMYNAVTDSVSLVLPHKQIDGAVDQNGNSMYFPDRSIRIPSADYAKGLGGIVTRSYTDKIKSIDDKINRFYYLTGGKLKQYIEVLSEGRAELPTSVSSWTPGDYVLVGMDMSLDVTSDRVPSTMYVAIPGIVRGVSTSPIERSAYISSTTSSGWNAIIKEIVSELDWATIINSGVHDGVITTTGWPARVQSAIANSYALKAVNEPTDSAILAGAARNWKAVIEDAVEQYGTVENANWPSKIMSILDAGEAKFIQEISDLVDVINDEEAEDEDRDAAKSQLETLTDGVYDGHDNVTSSEVSYYQAYYTKVGWAALVRSNSGADTNTWYNIVRNNIADSVKSAARSEIDWNSEIVNAYNAVHDVTAVPWEEVIADAILRANNDYAIRLSTAILSTIPSSLKSGICLGQMEGLSTQPTVKEVLDYFNIDSSLGSTSTIRGQIGIDYFRAVVETANRVICYYYVVTNTDPIALCKDPIHVTGSIALATDTEVGGFLNVPDTALGNGYVYRDDSGHLRLLDYDLLSTGILAYSLNQDYAVSSTAYSEIQDELDEYVNNRVAFLLQNSTSFEDVPVINLNIALSADDNASGGSINIRNIDSRFGTCVHVHISGTASSGTVINFIDCEKIRIDVATLSGNPEINIYRSNLYYDRDILNKANIIQDLGIWYYRFTEDDANITIDGMTVRMAGAPVLTGVDDYWSADTPNDNRYNTALRSFTLSTSGNITGVELYVACNITSNVELGTWIASRNFELNQSIGLPYPERRVKSQIKVTGQFISSYPSGNGYISNDVHFTALAGPYKAENVLNSAVTGTISMLVRAEYISNFSGLEVGQTIDAFLDGSLHIFAGGVVS